jgi:hypothetical protein
VVADRLDQKPVSMNFTEVMLHFGIVNLFGILREGRAVVMRFKELKGFELFVDILNTAILHDLHDASKVKALKTMEEAIDMEHSIADLLYDLGAFKIATELGNIATDVELQNTAVFLAHRIAQHNRKAAKKVDVEKTIEKALSIVIAPYQETTLSKKINAVRVLSDVWRQTADYVTKHVQSEKVKACFKDLLYIQKEDLRDPDKYPTMYKR